MLLWRERAAVYNFSALIVCDCSSLVICKIPDLLEQSSHLSPVKMSTSPLQASPQTFFSILSGDSNHLDFIISELCYF